MSVYTREMLQARRRRRERRVRVRQGALAVAVLATLAMLVHSFVDKPPAPAGPVPTGLFQAHARVFPKPDRLSRLAYVAVAGRRGREVALTFDDGPGPYTLQVVRTLRRLHTPATFFQVGVTEHYFTAAERAQLRDPLVTIGDHTVNHRRLDKLSPTDQAAEIDGDTAIIGRTTLFRPPYGAFDASTVSLLRARGMTMVMWSVDSQDYRRPGVDAIVANVLSAVKPGAIVLLHDAGGDRSQTIEALPRIVAGLRERHYTLVSVPRLLHDAPPPLKQPVMGIGAG